MKKHVGVFLLPHEFLDSLARERQNATVLDAVEGLEQNRWLELGLPLAADSLELPSDRRERE
jgi:CMP-2-keto-3-deoxyoctulosonic acid synthetase